MTSGWTLTLKNLCLPVFCQECKRRLLTDENGYFCPTCWELSRRIERPFCTVCGKPHQGRAGFGVVHNFPCGVCRLAVARPFGRIYGAAYYEGAVAEAIKLLKFSWKHRLAEALAERMIEFAQDEIDCAAYTDLVPVPLHRVRQRARGFNQSTLLATHLLPAFPNARLNEDLTRLRPTLPQSLLKHGVVRRTNLVGAFAVDRKYDFNGRHVLLIDDVVTSTQTVVECTDALKRAGAERVDVFAAALAMQDTSVPSPRKMRGRTIRSQGPASGFS